MPGDVHVGVEAATEQGVLSSSSSWLVRARTSSGGAPVRALLCTAVRIWPIRAAAWTLCPWTSPITAAAPSSPKSITS